jgi:hypothetical protein
MGRAPEPKRGFGVGMPANQQHGRIVDASGMPEAIPMQPTKLGAEPWRAAPAEALGGQRLRTEDPVAAERDLRNEALAMLDALRRSKPRNRPVSHPGELDLLEAPAGRSGASVPAERRAGDLGLFRSARRRT